MKTDIKLDILAQPTDESCGPTCLHALYRYYGVADLSLQRLSTDIQRLDSGGTLAEILAIHALERGFDATIITYHMQMFDPTWFAGDGMIHDGGDLASRLDKQLRSKPGDRRLRASTKAFKRFLALGGRLRFEDLTAALLARHLTRGQPIIAGLSHTYLYRQAREARGKPEDIRGVPQGHFVMLVGWDARAREVLVADPLDPNPPFHTAKYRLSVDRLINAILLGILTYDANLLVITPKNADDAGPHPARRRSKKGTARRGGRGRTGNPRRS